MCLKYKRELVRVGRKKNFEIKIKLKKNEDILNEYYIMMKREKEVMKGRKGGRNGGRKEGGKKV